MAFSARGRTQTVLADINITPLVDVVLVLLLIFMLTAPVLQSGIEVAVPQTRTVEQITEQRTVITIDKDQNIFLNNTGTDRTISINDLTTALGPSLPGSKRVVYIRADKQVPFGAFASVMDSIKQAGITNISIIMHPIENSSQQ